MFIAYLLYLFVKSAHKIIDTCLYIDAVTRVDGLQRDMTCHKLTLVNTEAGRPEVKKRKYANQHKILAESVRKYSSEDDVLKYLRKRANLF